MREYAIGIDVGGTNVRIGCSEKGGALEGYLRVPCSDIFTGESSTRSLAAFIEDYIEKYGQGERPQAVAVGFPATLSKNRRVVLQAPNVPGLDNVAAAEELEDLLHLPVYLERDVTLLYYCDMAANHLQPEGIGVGIYVGTGIGNAIFIDGVPLSGRDGVAGELGHMAVPGNHDACGCGNVGCGECVAAGWHLVKLQKAYFPETSMEDLFPKHGESAVLQEFVDNIACVVATEVNILNPDYIILGGGVINMPGFPMEALEKRIYAHARKPYPAESLCYYRSQDASENGVKGALVYAWDKLGNR